MATLGENISRAISDFNDIKTALNNGGIISNGPTSEYADNINNIINNYYYEDTSNTNFIKINNHLDYLANYTIYGNTYQEASPTIDNKYEPCFVGERTSNLFNYDTISNGYINSSSGVFMSSDKTIVSDFIEVEPDTTYSFIVQYEELAATSQRSIAMYDSNKDMISGYTYTVSINTTINTGNTTKYIRVSTDKNCTNIMLIKGTALPNEFIPYGYEIPIKTIGKNLLKNNCVSSNVKGIDVTVNSDGSITLNKKSSDICTIDINTEFELDINQQYKLIYEGDTLPSGVYLSIRQKNSENIIADLSTTKVKKLNNIDESINGIFKCYIYIPNGTTFDKITIKPMVTLFENDNTYEQYNESIYKLYLKEPLCKVDNVMDIYDYQTNTILRKIKKIIFNDASVLSSMTGPNTDGWYYTSYTLNNRNYDPEINTSIYNGFIVDNMDAKYTSPAYVRWSSASASVFRIYVKDTYINTFEGETIQDKLTSFINQHPITIWYPTTNVIEEHLLNCNICKIYTPSKEKYGLLNIQTSLNPSKVVIKYNKSSDLTTNLAKIKQSIENKNIDMSECDTNNYSEIIDNNLYGTALKSNTISNLPISFESDGSNLIDLKIYGNKGDLIEDNLFEGIELEKGDFNILTGELYNDETKSLRLSTKINVMEYTKYVVLSINTPYIYLKNIGFYDKNENYISYISNNIPLSLNNSFVTPKNTTKVILTFAINENNTDTVPNDISSYNNLSSIATLYENKYNGVGDKTANLFNISTIIESTYIDVTNNNGAIITSPYSSSNTSDFIKVKPNSNYTISYGINNELLSSNDRRIAFYSLNKIFVSSTSYSPLNTSNTFTTGATTEYIRIVLDKNMTNIMLIEGDQAYEEFIPYGYQIPIKTNGIINTIYLDKPLEKDTDYIDIKNKKIHRERKNLIPNSVVYESGYVSDVDGSITQADNEKLEIVSSYISINSSTQYTCSLNNYIIPDENNNWLAIGLYDKDTNFIERILDTYNYKSFTSPSNAKFIRISYRTYGNNSIVPQLEYGSDMTNYEAYIENIEENVNISDIITSPGNNTLDFNTTIKPSIVDITPISKVAINTTLFKNNEYFENLYQRNLLIDSVYVPNNMDTIGAGLFMGCKGLKNITIPRHVVNISSAAFQNCSEMLSVTMYDGITTLGGYAFYNCIKLKTINIPSTITSIYSNTFQSCSSLENVTLGNNFNSNNLNLSASTLYSVDTLVAMLNALKDRTSLEQYTLTLGQTNLDKLTAEQKAIAENKNWILA